MKIAVWLPNNISPTTGGGYSYHERLIHALDTHWFPDEMELCFVQEGISTSVPNLKHPVLTLQYLPKATLSEKILRRIPLLRGRTRRLMEQRFNRERNHLYTQTLHNADIQLIYYPTQMQCELPDFPFVATNWDIGHRSSWPFPEVNSGPVYDNRERFYNDILPRALMVLCESEAGCEELLRYTHLNPKRVKVAHLYAGEVAAFQVAVPRQQELLETYGLRKGSYFYYPAQFWAHKNHITLLKAFALFKRNHTGFKLMLTGSDQGNQNHIEKIIHNLGLLNDVTIGGFVPMETVSALYQNATALVMPTLMGPTNMPPLEAMELGCPVICSDLAGHREEMGDAALYFNPSSPRELADAMEQMVTNRDEYVQRINHQIQTSPFKLGNTLNEIFMHLQEASTIRSTWGETT